VRVHFNEKGTLVISAEYNTEMVALKAWHSEYKPDSEEGGKSVIAFDWNTYNEVKRSGLLPHS